MTLTPTMIGSKNPVLEIFATNLTIPDNFPVVLETDKKMEITNAIQQFDIEAVKMLDIAKIGEEATQSLHKILDQFLALIDPKEEPKIFALTSRLVHEMDNEHLDQMADKILNPDPSVWEKFKSFFTRSDAAQEAWQKIRELAGSKTHRIVDLINGMEKTLKDEVIRMTKEISNQEKLKEQYCDSFEQYAYVVLYANGCLEKSKKLLEDLEQTEPQGSNRLLDLKDKVQALESRALALEGKMSKIPSEQILIRQLQNAGIVTIQETTTTASERFADIKMTLLTINGALILQNLQRLDGQGAALSSNLQSVQSKLMKQVVTTSALAPGKNRLEQAEQLKKVVANSKELQTIVESARVQNKTAFDQAKKLFSEARSDTLQLGNTVKPMNKLTA